MPYHFRHNLDDGERLSVVDSDRGAEHLRENDHVSLMGADGFALSYLLQKLFLIFREFSLELSALTRRKELSQSIELQDLEPLRGMPPIQELFLSAWRFYFSSLSPTFTSSWLDSLLPVRRAAMLPTFRPGGAFRLTVFGRPGCCQPPPPNGWSTTFMATPRTRGYFAALERILWNFLPALTKGLSRRPPPATIPIIARQCGWSHFISPLGSCTTVFCTSCAISIP